MRNISQSNIKKIKIAFPTLEEQDEVVKILDTLIGKEEMIIHICDSVKKQIDLLKKSILSRAFRGKLGTNNPNEESAIELLKTIL